MKELASTELADFLRFLQIGAASCPDDVLGVRA